jgi:hypothetical protein
VHPGDPLPVDDRVVGGCLAGIPALPRLKERSVPAIVIAAEKVLEVPLKVFPGKVVLRQKVFPIDLEPPDSLPAPTSVGGSWPKILEKGEDLFLIFSSK